MALSYSAILRVPLTFTFTTLNTVHGYEFTLGGASNEPTVVSMLTNLKRPMKPILEALILG